MPDRQPTIKKKKENNEIKKNNPISFEWNNNKGAPNGNSSTSQEGLYPLPHLSAPAGRWAQE